MQIAIFLRKYGQEKITLVLRNHYDVLKIKVKQDFPKVSSLVFE